MMSEVGPQTILRDIPSPHCPFCAKRVVEPPAIPGPAVANAIRAATGARTMALPIKPEALARRLTRWT